MEDLSFKEPRRLMGAVFMRSPRPMSGMEAPVLSFPASTSAGSNIGSFAAAAASRVSCLMKASASAEGRGEVACVSARIREAEAVARGARSGYRLWTWAASIRRLHRINVL